MGPRRRCCPVVTIHVAMRGGVHVVTTARYHQVLTTTTSTTGTTRLPSFLRMLPLPERELRLGGSHRRLVRLLPLLRARKVTMVRVITRPIIQNVNAHVHIEESPYPSNCLFLPFFTRVVAMFLQISPRMLVEERLKKSLLRVGRINNMLGVCHWRHH